MVQSVLVLGGGSAGFLAAITVKYRLPDMPITVIRSPAIGIIGVGEATTNRLPLHLHGYLKLSLGEFYRLAEPIWKLGIRFLWGKRPYFDFVFGNQLDSKYNLLKKETGFYCNEGPFDYVGILSGLMTQNAVFLRQNDGLPVISDMHAYHIENIKFVAYLETTATRLGIVVKDDTVVEVLQNEAGVSGLRLASGSTANADLYLDCSGFKSVLLGQALQEPFISFRPSLFCDRAVVSEWRRGKEPIQPYTTAETMNAGWCWQIDHEHHINRGYVFSSDFISDDEAEAEFRAKNPKIEPSRIVKFKSGRYERGWVKNVVALGNSSGFVEPLESTALGVICTQSQGVAESLRDTDGHITPSLLRQFNKRFARGWDTIRRFLSIHYKFNTRLDTPFWQATRADVDLAGAEEFVEYYQDNGPSVLYRNTLIEQGDSYTMEGYLSLLVGQQVPYRRKYIPDKKERAAWNSIRQAVYNKVSQALKVSEALQVIRSPHWHWPAGLFHESVGNSRQQTA
jgi:tryptophan 7-halogenase